MTTQLAIAWFLTFFPITISPGPANVLLSSTAAQVGTRRTMPLVWGIFGMFVVQIVIVAVGVGEILLRYPTLFKAFKFIGVAYLLYLAWRFFQSSGLATAAEVDIGFKEGVLLQFFNFKAMTVPLIMYTQFLNPETSSQTQFVVLTVALLCLIIGSLMAWVVGGSFLQRLFQSEFGLRWQGKIFGVLLAAVAVWILFQ